jgi:signal transduction histidine kinase/CheY-like chemotaxis protein
MSANPAAFESSSDGGDGTAIAAFAHAHFVNMFVGANKRSQLGMFLASSLLAFLWFRGANGQWALGWWLLVLCYTGGRYLFSERWVRHPVPEVSAKRILVLLFMSGMAMAIPLFWFDRFTDIERAGITIIMCSTSAASVSTTAGYRRYFLAFTLPMLVPLQAAWIMAYWQEGWASSGIGLALLILVYLGVLLSVGKQSYDIFFESCQIRFAERALTQQLEAALERESEANRAKTQFLAAASHDLRQPIHSLNVLIAALAHRPLDDRSREIVRWIQAVNESLSSELDGLLEVSRLDAGAVKPMLTTISLSDLITAHADALAPLAEERGLRLEVTVQSGIHCSTDPQLLNRILGNLTGNALKFTPKGGRLNLSVSRREVLAVIEISDTGIGIAPEEQERVFREFYQVGNTERDRNHGLGLGLSIVRRYCKLLDIQLSLQSTLTRGTTVSLTMGVIEQSPSQVSSTMPPMKVRLPEGFTVLLLDDEVQIRSSMRLMFEEWGVRLIDVDSLDAAAQVLRKERVDHILSDLRLRGQESGLGLLPILTEIGLTTPLTLITGDTAPDRIVLAQQSGVQLLHKPVSAERIFEVLQATAGVKGTDKPNHQR